MRSRSRENGSSWLTSTHCKMGNLGFELRSSDFRAQATPLASTVQGYEYKCIGKDDKAKQT